MSLLGRWGGAGRSPLVWLGLVFVLLGAGLMWVGWPRERAVPGVPASALPSDVPLATVTVTRRPSPTRTREPLVPTAAPPALLTAVAATPWASWRTATRTAAAVYASPIPPTPTVDGTAVSPSPSATEPGSFPPPTGTPTMTPTSAAVAVSPRWFPPQERFRLGVSVPGDVALGAAYLAGLGVGWVMDWQSRVPPPLPEGVAYAQVVRFRGGQLSPDAAALTRIAAAQPGAVWLISNEADVRWQDNVTPEVYARLYHEAYVAIKAGDGGAVVAVGGIAQPTPLRLRYLDLVLAAYRAQFGGSLPADAWHIHNYMLREERDSWGVDIPPGLPDDAGVLYEIDDSGNLEAFRRQVVDFRRWMAERGYGGLPLIVSEFGVPMPPQYGFPPERMADFLQETWGFFLTATDPALGDPADGGRLVQRWCWFSLAAADYPTGDLVDLAGGRWTPLGQVWRRLVWGEGGP